MMPRLMPTVSLRQRHATPFLFAACLAEMMNIRRPAAFQPVGRLRFIFQVLLLMPTIHIDAARRRHLALLRLFIFLLRCVFSAGFVFFFEDVILMFDLRARAALFRSAGKWRSSTVAHAAAVARRRYA